MKRFNLVLSGGGVRSYAHLGVYKYCFESGFEFDEVVAVSGGSLIAPFVLLKKDPEMVIKLFREVKIHKMLFPFWFVLDKFECLFVQPDTFKLGQWLEKQFTPDELARIQSFGKLHIMATRTPLCGIKAMYTDMLKITDLKNSVAASSAISGVFKEHRVGECTYIDGGHWDNCPVFFDFENSYLPVLASTLGYVGLKEKEGGRVSKIVRGFEINSFARVQQDIERWEYEKSCKQRGDLFVVNPPVWNVGSLNFNLKSWQIDDMIETGYKTAKEMLAKVETIKVNPGLQIHS